MEDKRNIPIIEWEHLDKRKFYVFGICMTMMIRVSVYPFTLIRTRLQVQKGKSLYNGTFDAFVKILRTEGTAGLYRGFLVNTFTLISGQCYVTTYELTRKYVSRYNNNNAVKSLVAGGSASLVAQSITVPIDVISQHLMMQRKGESMGRFKVQSQDGKRLLVFGQTKDIIVQIFKADGFRGFYRGYVASLLTYIPNSAVWWPFYHFYAEQLSSLTPKDCPHLLLQAISGPLAAATASTLTNPMDVVRARVQVEGKSSIILTFKQLIAEEGPWGLTKGLSARIISATPSTIVIVVGYETLKKLSLRPELVDSRHWGFTKRGSALHPSVVPAQQALDMPPCLLEMESAEAAAECSGSECWNHWWSCWSSNFCTCSGHLIVVYKLTPVGSCSNNRFCSEKQNSSTPNRKAAVMLILTGTATLNLCQVQGQSQCVAWRGGSTSVGRHCQT
ncbi:hypothetical protein IHE44_0010598 [Lamprotornis superbus]|uniref:Solute carrier family 25 member 44 n=2 Tax=Sturnidae TaxID=9170 RepID=A0A835TR09_9PASS|nr:hypothetical protein IHE44_0010598 [Lamprotornis superbus]